MEWEQEVEIEESFDKYTWEMKQELIWCILRGGEYTFIGETMVSIEADDYP